MHRQQVHHIIGIVQIILSILVEGSANDVFAIRSSIVGATCSHCCNPGMTQHGLIRDQVHLRSMHMVMCRKQLLCTRVH